MRTILSLLLLGVAYASPSLERRQSTGPEVTYQDGTVIGSTTGNVDSFKGIPFAQPPTGTLRLKPPQTLAQPFGTITATGVPSSCPQMSFSLSGLSSAIPSSVTSILSNLTLFAMSEGSSEDCLTLNVQRPSSATNSSKLPVAVWIYGGGFEFGSTQMYDGTVLIEKSISMEQDIVFVTMNYRVGGFGWLAGKELQQDGSTNLGMRDQRLAIEWVADNIANFGGDPDKVTIWGESAGSISVFNQFLINRGNQKYKGKRLFRGGIMNSGSVVPALTVSSPTAQKVFDTVVAAGGCSGAADKLACLRALPFDQFNAAVNSVPGILSYRSVDLSYLPRPDPANNFFPISPDMVSENNVYTQVPYILGDQEDEGTLFSLFQSNISTTNELVTYLKSYFPEASRKLVAGLVATYPDNPSAGSPFRTGAANEIYPQFKRLAAILGDATFTLSRRAVLQKTPSNIPTWSYLNSYTHGTPVLGTFHGGDILEIFDEVPNPFVGGAAQAYYISFFNHLNPNTGSRNVFPSLPTWPGYKKNNPQLLHFNAANIGLLPDTFRQKNYNYLIANMHKFKV